MEEDMSKAAFGADCPMPRELVEGLLWEGGITLLIGNFNIGKSPLLLDLAIKQIHGIPLGTRRVEKLHVAYVALEDPMQVVVQRIKHMCQRLNVPLPKIPEQLDIYAGLGDIPHPWFRKRREELWAAVDSSLPEKRVEFLRKLATRSKEPTIVYVDPIQAYLTLTNNDQITKTFTMLRSRILQEKVGITILGSYNTRKADTRQVNTPSLLHNPVGWMENICGGKDLLSRSDGRLGVDSWYKGNVRTSSKLINGTSRGWAEVDPLIAEPRKVGDEEESQLAGFEYVQLDSMDWLELLSHEQLQYWNKLPQTFRWSEVENKVIPEGSLGRLLTKLQRIGVLKKDENRVYRKVLKV